MYGITKKHQKKIIDCLWNVDNAGQLAMSVMYDA